MMLSLARVLMEIEIGKSIEPGIAATAESAGKIERALDEGLYGLGKAWGLKHYVLAVDGCLSFYKSLDRERKKSPGTALPHLMAKVLYEQVVVHLETNMGLLPDHQEALVPKNLPLQRRITIPVQSKGDGRNINNLSYSDLMETNSPVAESPIDVLMDDSEEVIAHGDDK